MALQGATIARETGEQPPTALSAAVASARIGTLPESPSLRVVGVHNGPVLALALDSVEERYLLAVDSKARVCLYDVNAPRALGQPPPAAHEQQQQQHSTAITTFPPPRGNSRSRASDPSSSIPIHDNSISSVQWYSVDTGMFLTGGFDARVIAWDTNSFLPAFSWKLDDKVYCLSASQIAGHHSLVAAATADSRVRLIDLSTCGFTHTLLGHTEAVLSVAWSNSHEFVLASGSKDGSVRLWDVRRSGASSCLAVLDLHCVSPVDVRDDGQRRSAAAAAAAAAARKRKQPEVSSGTGRAHIGGVNALLWAPPASHPDPVLITGGADARMRRWDVKLRIGVAPTRPPPPPTDAAAAAHSSNFSHLLGLASSSSSSPNVGSVAVGVGVYPRDLLTGDPVEAAVTHAAHVSYGGMKNSFRHALWPVIASLERAGGTSSSTLFSPQSDGSILAHDLDSGTLVGVLRGHQAGVNALAFCRPNQELLSVGDDGMIFGWGSEMLAAERTPLSPRE